MFLFNSPQLHVGHNIMTVTIWLSIYNKIEIFMGFVSNFIYLIKFKKIMINVLCLFLLHFTIFQKQPALESKYVNAYHIYRFCYWRTYNSTNQNT